MIARRNEEAYNATRGNVGIFGGQPPVPDEVAAKHNQSGSSHYKPGTVVTPVQQQGLIYIPYGQSASWTAPINQYGYGNGNGNNQMFVGLMP